VTLNGPYAWVTFPCFPLPACALTAKDDDDPFAKHAVAAVVKNGNASPDCLPIQAGAYTRPLLSST